MLDISNTPLRPLEQQEAIRVLDTFYQAFNKAFAVYDINSPTHDTTFTNAGYMEYFLRDKLGLINAGATMPETLYEKYKTIIPSEFCAFSTILRAMLLGEPCAYLCGEDLCLRQEDLEANETNELLSALKVAEEAFGIERNMADENYERDTIVEAQIIRLREQIIKSEITKNTREFTEQGNPIYRLNVIFTPSSNIEMVIPRLVIKILEGKVVGFNISTVETGVSGSRTIIQYFIETDKFGNMTCNSGMSENGQATNVGRDMFVPLSYSLVSLIKHMQEKFFVREDRS